MKPNSLFYAAMELVSLAMVVAGVVFGLVEAGILLLNLIN